MSGILSGKTVLVTGATGGIGRVTAQELAMRGAHVVIVGRNPEKIKFTLAEIRQHAGEDAASALTGDLSVQAEVRRVAREFREKHHQLHVLINNAGAMYSKRQESRDGIEMTWALNHLAYFLLTTELLGLIQATPGARVVNVSSEAHRMSRMHWNDPEFKAGYSAWQAYGQSKLANILFTRALAWRLRGTGVTSNALHPGMIASGFGRNNEGLTGRLYGLLAPFSLSEEQGAQTSIYLASSPEVDGVSGRYFSKSKEAQPAPYALDDAAAERLWTLSEDLVESPVGA